MAIIKFLALKGPQTSDKVEVSIMGNFGMIRECLGLLIEQRLLEKGKNYNNLETYANTERSERVLDFFHVQVQPQIFRKVN